MTNSRPRGRSCWLASRMPRGWAMPPMNPWPIIRTLIFFMAGLLPPFLRLLRGGLRLGLHLGLRLRNRLLRGGLGLRHGLLGRLGGDLGGGLRGAAVDQGVQVVGALLSRLRLGPRAVLEAEVDGPPVVRAARIGGQLLQDRRELDLGGPEHLVAARPRLAQ